MATTKIEFVAKVKGKRVLVVAQRKNSNNEFEYSGRVEGQSWHDRTLLTKQQYLACEKRIIK